MQRCNNFKYFELMPKVGKILPKAGKILPKDGKTINTDNTQMRKIYTEEGHSLPVFKEQINIGHKEGDHF